MTEKQGNPSETAAIDAWYVSVRYPPPRAYRCSAPIESNPRSNRGQSVPVGIASGSTATHFYGLSVTLPNGI